MVFRSDSTRRRTAQVKRRPAVAGAEAGCGWGGGPPWPGPRCLATAARGCERKLQAVRTIVVDVMLKAEIHDPQGEAILSACHRLGFGEVRSVRQGKRFELEV